MMTRVQFEFGDRLLCGEVVDRQPAPRFPNTERAHLIVETDAGRYRPLESDTEIIERE